MERSKFQDKTTLAQGPDPDAPGARGTALVLYYRDGVKVVPLDPGTSLVIGRAWPADVVVEDMSLSRQHARVTWGPRGLEVEDLGSTNGTHVRGERITEARVTPGEAVLLGSITMSVNVAGADGHLKGIDSHERFMRRLEEEVLRARTLRRSLALVMIRAVAADDGHLSTWVPRVRGELRAIDHLALYGPGSVLALLPESGRDDAMRAIHPLVMPRIAEPTLLAGIAVFPEAATTEELVDEARRAARQASSEERVCLGGTDPARATAVERVVVASDAMRRVYALVQRVAPSPIPVLIIGETGSGKELVAHALHTEGPRRKAPTRSINCGAIPATLIESVLFGHVKGAFTGADDSSPGVFEQAHGGTVFLDEVGELSPAAQAALLRVLETKRVTRVGGTDEIEVDVRVVAATHRDLEQMVMAGQFRQDLLYRLNAMTIEVPPLRARPEEIEPLAERFLEEARRASGGVVRDIDEPARRLLRTYAWPGNVRELRNVIERAVIIAAGESIQPEDLSERLRGTGTATPSPTGPTAAEADVDFKERVRQYEVDLILDALRRAEGNQTQAAKLLKMPLRTLVHKIKVFGIRKLYDT